ncbi:MAG TPA: hypothetical protein VLA23_01015 [Candidatus Limnocylindrales bacterium]|nr:hypothetical protein [Candidatus Limnocylindrales bacterium]
MAPITAAVTVMAARVVTRSATGNPAARAAFLIILTASRIADISGPPPATRVVPPTTHGH